MREFWSELCGMALMVGRVDWWDSGSGTGHFFLSLFFFIMCCVGVHVTWMTDKSAHPCPPDIVYPFFLSLVVIPSVLQARDSEGRLALSLSLTFSITHSKMFFLNIA